MQLEESCSSLLSEWGGSNGGCACPDIHVKPFGTSSIPGHSAEINGCYSEVSSSCCQSKKCKPWHLRAEHLGMLQMELHRSAEEISAAVVWPSLCVFCHCVLRTRYNSKPHFYIYDILYYSKLVWRKSKYHYS